MSNTIIEKHEAAPFTAKVKLTADQKASVQNAFDTIQRFNEQAKAITPAGLSQLAATAARALAEGAITLETALVVCSVTSDKINAISDLLTTANTSQMKREIAPFLPAVIEVKSAEVEKLRQQHGALITRETEDAGIYGLDYEPSNTANRLHQTFKQALDRLRELREGALPSRSELREMLF